MLSHDWSVTSVFADVIIGKIICLTEKWRLTFGWCRNCEALHHAPDTSRLSAARIFRQTFSLCQCYPTPNQTASSKHTPNSACTTPLCTCWQASDVTGCHQSPKRTLRAGCRAPSQCKSHKSYFSSLSVITHFLCTMHVLHIRASLSYPRLPLCQILWRPPLLS